jgi:hypothetical protein
MGSPSYQGRLCEAESLGKHGDLEEDRACIGNTCRNKEGFLRAPFGVNGIFLEEVGICLNNTIWTFFSKKKIA